MFYSSIYTLQINLKEKAVLYDDFIEIFTLWLNKICVKVWTTLRKTILTMFTSSLGIARLY
jgi:hypothetical protein